MRLFLSAKTVESHLRNIFGKLGVASRVDQGSRGDELRQECEGCTLIAPRDVPDGPVPAADDRCTGVLWI